MSTEETWTLGHRPALDGLRGIAVLLVVASHLALGSVRTMGYVGVTMFFALSGFLITTLLLEERAESGRVDLRSFYARRLLRLAPALIAVTMVVAALGLADVRSVLSTLTYTSNFVMAGGVKDDALMHTWSLAIEEQFYLAWPLLLLAGVRLGRGAMLVLLSAAVLGVSWLRLDQWAGVEAWDRIYYSTDTRADSLLIGCALAVAMHGTRRRVSPLASAGAAGALAVVGLCAVSNPVAVLLFGPLVVAAATAAGIYWCAQSRVRWLEGNWLTLVGRRSYGLYLWHVPVVVVIERAIPDAGWLLTLAIAGPVAWGLTLLSWRYVEQPAQRLRTRFTSTRPHDAVTPAATCRAGSAA